jgi:hypothetical protein
MKSVFYLPDCHLFIFYSHFLKVTLIFIDRSDQATKQAAMVPTAANKNLGAEMHKLPPCPSYTTIQSWHDV